MTRITPRLRMILHLLQIFLTEARTFIFCSFPSDPPASYFCRYVIRPRLRS